MHTLLTLSMLAVTVVLAAAPVLASNAGTDAGSTTGQGGGPGTDEGFGQPLELPELAYPAIAAGVFLALLLVTFAFRSSSKRH